MGGFATEENEYVHVGENELEAWSNNKKAESERPIIFNQPHRHVSVHIDWTDNMV